MLDYHLSQSSQRMSDKRNFSPASTSSPKVHKKIKKTSGTEDILNDTANVESVDDNNVETDEANIRSTLDTSIITVFGLSVSIFDKLIYTHKIIDQKTKKIEEEASFTFNNKWLYIFKYNNNTVSYFLK